MLFLLCTAGVEIMRHSSVAARAPQQTHTVCIRYWRFCKGSSKRCTQPDANFDRGVSVYVIHVSGVVFTGCLCWTVTLHCPWVLGGPLAFHLWPLLSRGSLGNLDREEWQTLGEIIMRFVNCNAVWWPFSLLRKKKNSDLCPVHSPNTWVTGNY